MAERILLKALDGRWEVLGVDRDRGATPESIQPTWNAWGPDAMTFTLKRDPSLEHVDLQPFTPVRWEVEGRLLWDGFTIDRPGGGDGLTVSCLGRQHELDDDVFSELLVHADLSEWQDTRSFPTIPFIYPRWLSQFEVRTEGGVIDLVMPEQSNCDPLDAVSVTLDCGPDPRGWPTHYDLDCDPIVSGVTANFNLIVRCHDADPQGGVGYIDSGGAGFWHNTAVQTAFPGAGIGGTLDPAGTNRPRRFVSIIYARSATAPAVVASGSDNGVRISKLILYGAAAYRLGGGANRSILKVSDIIKVALPYAPGLDQATDEITATSLELRHADWRLDDLTPREVMEQWNTYHRFQLSVRPGGKLRYRPIPSRATLRCSVNTKGGATWVEGSAQSGRELYNKVVVLGQSGSGRSLKVVRSTAQALLQAGAQNMPTVLEAPALQPPNPSADVNSANWAMNDVGLGGAMTVARDATVFDTGPASIKVTQGAALGEFMQVKNYGWPAGGVFEVGRVYVIRFALRASVPGDGHVFNALIGDVHLQAAAYYSYDFDIAIDAAQSDVWQTFELTWVPLADCPSQFVEFWVQYTSNTGAGGNATALWVDSLELDRAAPTLLDKRKRQRSKILQIGSPTDPAAMQSLADAFLTTTMRVPLKGQLDVPTDNVVTDLLTGRPVPTTDLGNYVGELVLLDNLIDPDTGAFGRVGTLAAVNYAGGTASIVIDNARDNFEALLARMGIVRAG